MDIGLRVGWIGSSARSVLTVNIVLTQRVNSKEESHDSLGSDAV